MKSPLKVGIIGLGHLHPRLYMPLFEMVKETEVTSVYEPNENLRNAFCNDFNVKGYDDLNKMLNAEQLDVAAIFLPHADCAPAAIACAQKGIHLMVEKPMTAVASDTAKIIKAAADNNVKLSTGYCWRLHPASVEFKKIVQSGIIGKLVGAEGRCAAGKLERYIIGHSPWMLQKERSGGGPMYNLGVHWIDLFRWILEDEVSEVSGQNVKINTEYDIEDNSFAHLRFKKGTIVSLDISYTVPESFPHGRDLYLSVRGTKGVISWAPAYEGDNDVLNICSDMPEYKGSPRREIQLELEPVKGYSGYMGLAYVQAFADAVLKNTPLPITGEDGLAALKIVEAVYKSAQSKKWEKVD